MDMKKGIRLPRGRAGHYMTIIGNPEDYILIFGGVSVYYITPEEHDEGRAEA